MFARLYLKDIQDIKMESAIFMISVAAWNIFLYMKYLSGWPYQLSVGQSLTAFGIAAFIPFIESFKLLWDEWKHNTVYLIMSLPVSGTMVLLSKLAVIITQYVALSLFSAVCFLLLAHATPAWEVMWSFIRSAITDQSLPLKFAALFYASTVAGMIYTAALAFLSSVVGKLAKKLSGLASLGTFLIAGYVCSRASDLISRGLEKIGVTGLYYDHPDVLRDISISGFPAAPALSLLIVGAIVFILAVRVYESAVEL